MARTGRRIRMPHADVVRARFRDWWEREGYDAWCDGNTSSRDLALMAFWEATIEQSPEVEDKS